MLKRKAFQRLLDWKQQGAEKALCIIGARQIGKTSIVRAFGKQEYAHFLEINFIKQPLAKDIFKDLLDVNTLLTNLSAFTQKKMVPGKTLIFLDEIQECPQARTAMKFLVEDHRFDYVESGSLLGVKYKDVPSYPVGFEDIYQMTPMDFEEFLWANGVQPDTITMLHQCFDTNTPVHDTIHHTLCKLFYAYIIIGGMPEVVQTYVDTHDIAQVIQKQQQILRLYRLDIGQYAQGSDRIKIQSIFDSIPSQLDDKNRRFVLTAIDENARHNRYADSFHWLEDAGVALPCYNVSEPQPPLRMNEKNNLFKLYMGDTGLLCAACMDNIQFAILQGAVDINMGSILENAIAQQLTANGFRLNYYNSKKNGELDFVLQNGMHIDLIEVKSGNDYHRHAALDKVRRIEAWHFNRSIVLCKGNLEMTDGIQNMPWYMCRFLTPKQPPKELLVDIDISGL